MIKLRPGQKWDNGDGNYIITGEIINGRIKYGYKNITDSPVAYIDIGSLIRHFKFCNYKLIHSPTRKTLINYL